MRRQVPGRMAAARPAERAALTLGRVAGGGGGGGTGGAAYLLFEHEGRMYRARPHPVTGERVWSHWPTGEVCPCPMAEVG